MEVGINTALRASGGGYRQTGVSRYLTELTRALRDTAVAEDRLLEFGLRLGPVARSVSTRILWEQTCLAADIARHRLDVFHGPVNALPVALRAPGVVTIHDLAFLRFPHHLPAARRAWLIGAIRHSARAAARVITISEQTASDLVDWLRLDRGKIRVIPLAVAPGIRRLSGAELRVFRLRYGQDRPYILVVGTLEPRKNLPMLLRAFAAIRDRVPHRLVLVGPEGWLTGELHETIRELGLGDRLVLSGFVSDAELGGWYSAADLVAFPSWYEGFGLPMLEAMSCGAPVLAANTSSLPEVGGDAAAYADPGSQDAWSATLLDLLSDPSERQRLSVAGMTRAEHFSWERTARETWDVYREVAR
ncbi:MAG TPA: glycosyltransferase family 1 protein [Thermomicrobiales bacterium]|nr:glycosyltransferase family 1 protein [Thermomicrobiales bacterium]